ncbi:MAG: arsenite methyltransferase [Candidatus Promineifilaceae bacterium]
MDVNTKESKADVRSHVREHYGKIAADFQAGAQASCCSPADAATGCCEPEATISLDQIATLYDAPDAAELPDEVTGLSLGCGDPVTLASLRPGQTVLDLGSGGGIDCFLAGKRVGETGRVIGVDMTSQMIEKARANKAKVGAENVEFRLGEIEHLPAADRSVDVIISNCVINLSPDKSQVFREAFRVLKPGGKLAVSDIVTDGPLPNEVKASLAGWAGCVSGALEVSDYVAGLEQAGFIDIEVTPVYFDESTIIEAAEQTGFSEVVKTAHQSGDQSLFKSVYSAKITAIRPNS